MGKDSATRTDKRMPDSLLRSRHDLFRVVRPAGGRRLISCPAAAILVLLGLVSAYPRRGAAAPAPSPRRLPITVTGDTWGDASRQNIEAVLQSAGQEIWRYCSNTTLPAIRVYSTDQDPIMNFTLGDGGHIRIGLNVRGRHWAQFAFQFAHEFAHALAMHPGDGRSRWKNSAHANQWFEESLCESASLFALRRMAGTWATQPPYPNWKSYAPHLEGYAQERMQAPTHQLPAGRTFAAWFQEQEPSLRTNATQRSKNTLIAVQLLPLLEESPRHWETLTTLNLGRHDKNKPFALYLSEWRSNSPAEYRPFIDRVATCFGIRLEP
jgi:hypothetical protein